MDCKPDISKIKQEKRQIIEEENNDFVVRVKVENDVDWESIQTVLDSNEYQDNTSYDHENYEHLIRYCPNEKYQEQNYKEIKQESSQAIDYDVIDFIQQNEMMYQDKISYGELKEDRMQTCLLCGKCFSNSYLLLQHNLTHLEVPLIKRKLFMCEHCPKYYMKKDSLKNHILINHYRIIVCHNDETLITKQNHKCLICDKTYTYKTWFGHMAEVHCVRKFKCDKCGLSFKARRYLERHVTHIHKKVKRNYKKRLCPVVKIKCPKCPAQLNSKFALTTHLRNCHSSEKFTCHLCKSTLKCKSYLLTHLKRVHHNDGVLHQCEICSKEFKSHRYLKIHIKNSHRNHAT